MIPDKISIRFIKGHKKNMINIEELVKVNINNINLVEECTPSLIKHFLIIDIIVWANICIENER